MLTFFFVCLLPIVKVHFIYLMVRKGGLRDDFLSKKTFFIFLSGIGTVDVIRRR